MSAMLVWEHADLIDCPIDPAVWIDAAESREARVVIEVQPGASPTMLAAELSNALDAVPIVLDRFILSSVDLEEALTVLLPLTRWGTFLLRIPSPDIPGSVSGEAGPAETVAAVDRTSPAANSELREVPWSNHDQRRREWLERLVRYAGERHPSQRSFDELLEICQQRARANQAPLIAGVSANRPVDRA